MRTNDNKLALRFALAAVLAAGLAGADSLVISGGTVHPMTGEPFVGNIVIEDGIITAVGADVTVPADAAAVIDASGLHVYPGMVDAFSQLGLVEVNAVASTDDQAEMGAYNPHLHAATAVHPASELIPVARSNGITHSLIAPDADDDSVILGQAVLAHLAGWTIEEMTLEPAAAMVIEWPEIRTRRFDFATFSMKESPFNDAKEEAEKKVAELASWLEAARHYRQASEAGSDRLERDIRLEALAGVLDGGQTVVVKANRKRDIESAVEFAEQQQLEIVLAGARDGWKVAEMLAEKEIPVILGTVQSLPAEADDPYDKPFKNAAALVAAGVKIAFSSGAGGGFGPGGPHNVRTLPYEAATAVAYGLDAGDAMRALTLWPAEMLGVGDRVGSIETGKVANLMVVDGDPLEIISRVEHLVIGGEQVPTANRHRALYQTYRAR